MLVFDVLRQTDFPSRAESRVVLKAHVRVHNRASLMGMSRAGGATLGLNHKYAEAEASFLS